MSRRSLYAMTAVAVAGLFVLINFREIRPKLTRIVSSGSHSFDRSPEDLEVKSLKFTQAGNVSHNLTLSNNVNQKESTKISKEEEKKEKEKREAEEKAQKEAEEKAQKEAEEKARKEVEDKARKEAAEKLEKEKIRLMEEDTRIQKANREQEKLRQELEKTRLELEEQKKWLKNEMDRFEISFEEYKKANLKKRGKKTGDPERPGRVVDAESARLKLKSLQGKTKGLFLDLDPVEIHSRWPGLMLDGDYVLREFIDPKDPRALGMTKKPQTIEEMTDADAEDRFYQMMTINHLHCADKRRMGNFGDGGWDICVSGPYEPQEGCVVYSFGINDDFTFDDAMSQVYGCQVKSYDPSMKQADHKRSDHVFFYKTGLGSADTTDDNGWRLMSLESIFKANGHIDKTIDYLKIDIEYSEWAALEVALERKTLKNVKQFSLEIHTMEVIHKDGTKVDFLRFYNVLLGLEKQGFRRFHYHYNPFGRYTSKRTGKERTCCYEMYYININFLKDS